MRIINWVNPTGIILKVQSIKLFTGPDLVKNISSGCPQLTNFIIFPSMLKSALNCRNGFSLTSLTKNKGAWEIFDSQLWNSFVLTRFTSPLICSSLRTVIKICLYFILNSSLTVQALTLAPTLTLERASSETLSCISSLTSWTVSSATTGFVIFTHSWPQSRFKIHRGLLLPVN